MMSRSALGYLRRQYMCVLRRNAMLMASVALAGVNGAMAQTGGIVADGRTQTQVTVGSAVTDVRTQTVRGVNAFNSFSKFNVDAAKTVNLILPAQTNNLLNLVTGEASYINGLVNSYKNGQIGGNVYFLNPYGVVVGSGGVLNVGSLTLVTPTTGFMDRLMSASGAIDDAATAAVLAGQIPLSPTGLVSVKGRINAAEAVNLAGGNVDIGVGAQVFAGGKAQVAFADLVNVSGIALPNTVSFDGGVVRISAANNISVAGQVSADGAGSNAKGGTVNILADRNSSLASTGQVSANGKGGGDGGFVEFSAKGDVSLAGNGLSARSDTGKAGTILIDPTNLTWTSANDFYSHGATVTISADKNVELDGVFVSSRNVANGDSRSNHSSAQSVGNSGDINVSAKRIKIINGTQLRADADNGKTAGNVNITATDDASTPVFGSAEDQSAYVVITNSV
ncbi:MAG: leukotoxin LktA family filamentous adhesin, partial [Rhodoferax sp.]